MFLTTNMSAMTLRANQQVILGIDSLSIRPSLGVRGEEILGRGGRKRESCPSFCSPPLPPEKLDTAQARELHIYLSSGGVHVN